MLEEYQSDSEWQILKNGTQIHRTALVAPWVMFDDNCIVNPYAIVGRSPDYNLALARQPEVKKVLKFGKNNIIGCHAIVFSGSLFKDNCFIGDHALVREGCIIDDNCMIGCHVSISYDCKIGARSRFQNGTVFHGFCGEDCFFGVGVVCSSDRNINLNDYQHKVSEPPIFGNKVMVGSGANIIPRVKIGDNVLIGAGAVVTKDVGDNCKVFGKPAEVLEQRIEEKNDKQLVFKDLASDYLKTIINISHHPV